MSESLRFRPRQRLCRQRDFDRVFGQRCSVADGLLVVYLAANGLEWSRLGIKAGRSLGGAVVRNRIKRRIREAFRTRQHDLPIGLDVICIPRPGATAQASTDKFARSLEALIARARKKLGAKRGGTNGIFLPRTKPRQR